MSAFSLQVSRKHHPSLPDPLPGNPWYVLIQADDSAAQSTLGELFEAALAAAIEAGTASDATIAQSSEQANDLWTLRENIAEAQRREGPNIKHDISLPVSAIPRFLDEAAAALVVALPGLNFVTFGHLGDGNLHYNLAAPAGVDAEAFMANAPCANRIVHDLVTAHGGSISAEHGIGQLKREELVHYKSAIEIDLMRAIKVSLDPAGTMNPGKVL
jgi:FAD/FMN-containing dehydrogenase